MRIKRESRIIREKNANCFRQSFFKIFLKFFFLNFFLLYRLISKLYSIRNFWSRQRFELFFSHYAVEKGNEPQSSPPQQRTQKDFNSWSRSILPQNESPPFLFRPRPISPSIVLPSSNRVDSKGKEVERKNNREGNTKKISYPSASPFSHMHFIYFSSHALLHIHVF